MTFSLHMGADQGSPIVENAKIGADSAKINLRSVSYRCILVVLVRQLPRGNGFTSGRKSAAV